VCAQRLAARVEAARAARAAWARRQPQPLRVLAQLLAGGWNAINDNFKVSAPALRPSAPRALASDARAHARGRCASWG
jgi:hypothetical protein